MDFFVFIPVLTVILAEWMSFRDPGYRGFHYEISFFISWMAMQLGTIAWMLAFRDVPPALFF